MHHHHPEDGGALRVLALVLGLTAGYAVAEAVGGWLTGSLALLADAGHMATDILALSLALLAGWSARRPPSPRRTYGYQRAEILAALFNGVVLVAMALLIFVEAWRRLRRPLEVAYLPMGAIALGGLAVNLIAARLLHRHAHGLNVRAAYLHVLGDLLGSVAALAAAGAIALYGWTWADPLASAGIGGIIVFSAVRVVLDSVGVLMEGAPAHLDARLVRGCLLEVPGVAEVHDLHLWSLGGGNPLLSAHLVLDHTRASSVVLREATRALRERFTIVHTTLQLEPPDFNIVPTIESAQTSKRTP